MFFMIQINQHISLQEIQFIDASSLYSLMQEVYPHAYQQFWNDNCSWYLNSQYSESNIYKELQNIKANYYFVLYKGKRIGNFRIIWDDILPGFENLKCVKLHRIYLHQSSQGNGIGKILLDWFEYKSIENNYDLLWLDAMNKKEQAYIFYQKRGYKYHSHTYLNFELIKKEYSQMSQLYKILT